jgi:hypothetical protein
MNAKIREDVILEFLAQESLNLELWLERYEDLKLRGLFYGFIFQKSGVWLQIPDHGLIS